MNKIIKSIILIIIFSSSVFAKVHIDDSDFPKNSIYLNGSSLLITSHLGLFYNRVLNDSFTADIGISYSYVLYGTRTDTYFGGEASLRFYSPKISHFEIGAGIGIYYQLEGWLEQNKSFLAKYNKHLDYFPIINLAYKNNFDDSKLYYKFGFRIGYGLGLNLALGYAF